MASVAAVAKTSHQWKPGQSGNPAGRPKGLKNRITALKQELEVAVRDNLRPNDIKDVITEMVKMAKGGNVGAAKLILDKVLSNAREAEEDGQVSGQFIFQVKNLTLKHEEIIDITPSKEPSNGEQDD